MAARVTRFFGQDVLWWLMTAPLLVLRRCSAMLSRLQAEESILSVHRMAVATGSFSNASEGTRLMKQWARVANDEPAAHQAFTRSVETLKAAGVIVYSPKAKRAKGKRR